MKIRTDYHKALNALTVEETLALIEKWNNLFADIMKHIYDNKIDLYARVPVDYKVEGVGNLYNWLNGRIANNEMDWRGLIVEVRRNRDKLEDRVWNAKAWGK